MEESQITRQNDLSNSAEFWFQHDISKVLDRSTLLVCYVDNQMVFRYVNQPYADHWNLTRREIVGRTIGEIISKEYAPISEANAQRALEGVPFQLEQEIKSNGRSQFFHNKYQPDLDADGNVAGFFLFSDEITHLKEKEQNLIRIFDNVAACLFWVDCDLVIKYAGQGGLKHFGFDANDVIGLSIEEFIGKDAFKIALPRLQKALNGNPEQYENRTLTADGRQLEIQVHCVPDLDRQGLVQGLFVVSFDITPIKRTQRELKRAKTRLDTAVQGSQFGVWETDPSRKGWCFTDHLEYIWGLEPNSLSSSIRKLDSRIHPDDYPKILESRRQNVEENIDNEVEFRALTNRGYRWMRTATNTQYDDSGIPIRRSGTITDINQIKTAQIKSADEVEQRDMFLAMLSHELRNPMTAIYHAIYYAQETGDLPDSLIEIFDIIDRQSKQMTRLMDDLLDVSRFTQDKIQFKYQPVDLGETIKNVVTDFGTKCTQKKQDLTNHPMRGPCWVRADPNRLNQAITNLLDNAIKYTQESGAINISVEHVDDKYFCSISDNGAGIPREKQIEIFELFVQTEQPLHRTIDGLGVGLFLVRRIIREMGGDISLRSDGLNQGSTFTFWLPQTPPPTPIGPPTANGEA